MTDFTVIHIHIHGQDNSAFSIIDYELMAQVQPFMHRLEKLALINNFDHDRSYIQFRRFFEFFRQKLPFLRSLKLKNFDNSENCLQFLPNELSNIAEIHLIHATVFRDLAEFQSFLMRLKNLQVFVYMCRDCDFNFLEEITNCLFERFPSLKGFGCSIQKISTEDESSDRFKFLEKFKHLTELHISGSIHCKIPSDVQNIIKFVPNIKLLSLYQLQNMNHLPVVIRRIGKTIKELIDARRNRFPPNDCVHIIVNDKQYREFRAIKNIDKYISLENTYVNYGIFLLMTG